MPQGTITFINDFQDGGKILPDSGPPEITFRHNIPGTGLNVGSCVTYELDANGVAINLLSCSVVTCDITIDTDTSGNQIVPEGKTLCVVNGATLTGNIKTDGGNIIVKEGSTVTGNLKVDKGDTGTLGSITIEGASTVGGNVKIDESSAITVNGSTVSGNVKADETQDVKMDNNNVNGNVKVDDCNNVSVTGNTIGGNLKIDDTTGSCDSSSTPNNVTGNVDGCP
ncbi:MAG: hypothetical protein COA57_12635 [Flavobacteriales bacterium]|nr:MAG: hypothetical protein COA57_12635 [Flavobacteriales bacterium]